jgi:glycosyltransferase involved in cell wall biosynthesis
MVTHNEAGRYLRPCLEWLAKAVDKIVIYDDRSTDRTVEICEERGCTVHVREGTVPAFVVNEAEFRSAAWRTLAAEVDRGDWILCIDADEFLVATNGETERGELDRLAEMSFGSDGYQLGVREVFDVVDGIPMIRVDNFWGSISGVRYVEWTPDAAFPDKKMGCGSVPAAIQHTTMAPGIDILHYGYTSLLDRESKYNRYSRRAGHNPKHIASILTTPTLKRYEHHHPGIG